MVIKEKNSFWKNNRFRFIRLLSQIFFFIVLNIGLFISASGIFQSNSMGGFTLPIEQGLAGPFSVVSGAYNMLEYYFSSALIPYLVGGIFLLIGMVFGRSTCSWVCPFGFVQELVAEIPQTKIKPVKETEKLLSNIPYIVVLISLGLSIIVGIMRTSVPLSAPLGGFSNGPYTEFDPYHIMISVVPWRVINGTFPVYTGDIGAYFGQDPFLWVQIFWLLIILIINIWIPQAFCRYICPTGLILGHLNEYTWFGLTRDPVYCLKDECRICEQVCPMNIPILKLPYDKIKHRKCIFCLKCVEKCPHNAIKLSPF
ncbi:MAG: 4Fe-4S binding protein [Candidatus Helarchaeota archaeon]